MCFARLCSYHAINKHSAISSAGIWCALHACVVFARLHLVCFTRPYCPNSIAIWPQALSIKWDAYDAVSQSMRDGLSVPCRAIKTNGDGACALHATYGVPTADKELAAPAKTC